MENDKARILVVEDDPAILQGLMDLFVFHGYRATGEPDGAKGLELLLGQSWDLCVLDVMLPNMDGYTICRELRRDKPDLAVLMLTAKGSEDDIVAGFKAGADDYVSKPFSLRELMVRVEALLRRTGAEPAPERLEMAGVVLDGAALTATCQGRNEPMTRREIDILAHLYRHRPRIVSRRELLADVWHYPDPEVETRTVDIHMAKLRKKLAALCPDGNGPAVGTVRGQGYRLETPDQGPGTDRS